MKKTSLLAFTLTALTVACGPSSPGNSSLTWSHVTAEHASGTIPALLAYGELGFETNFKRLRVCVQGSESYSGSELLLETKLAYAAWLEASGRGLESNWDRFSFVLSEHCDLQDTSFASSVVIASHEKRDPRQAEDFTVLTCSPSSCLPRGFTTGWGGPGAITYSFPKGNASVWSNLAVYQPSVARLSPYLHWESLETELKLQLQGRQVAATGRAPALDRDVLVNLWNDYQSLKARVKTVDYSSLAAFNRQLSQQEADSRASFGIIATPSSKASYQMQLAGFHTLLHEVGHQFGMMHAHVKSSFTDNGMVKGTGAKKEDGFWETDDATMAYQNSYFYLSPDDRAGIRDLTTKVYAELRTHQPHSSAN